MGRPADIRDLLRASVSFSERFDQARQTKTFDAPWYAYDSLGNLVHFDRLLHAPYRDLLALCDSKPILDIGCADGQLALFLDSLGVSVTAVDNPGTNANSMEGVRALRAAMNANIDIAQVDLDEAFAVPEPGKFGLTFLLGVLYHLQNPLYVLRKLSRHTRYCLLSTRIARYSPDGALDLSRYPVAWLAGEDEVNSDCTNYWIFSEVSLRRAFERTGWRVRCFLTVGDTETSDPVRGERDERAFCLLESKHALDFLELLDGWFPAEAAGWRWTAQDFRIRVSRASELTLTVCVPDVSVEKYGSLSLVASCSGREFARATWTEHGVLTWRIPLPPEAATGPVEIDFHVSHPVPSVGPDVRTLGLIVASADLA